VGEQERFLELGNRQKQVIAQGCLTNSKAASSFVEGPYPTHVKHAFGCKIHTSDGRTLTDTYAALGTISLGFNDGKVNEAAIRGISEIGSSHSLPTHAEVEAAEYLLTNYLQQFDCVKYVKTGAEATSAAVRISRSTTNRSQVLSLGYHGWHDLWLSTKNDPKGLGHHEYDIFEFESLTQLADSVSPKTACVIVEPIMLEYSAQVIADLEALKIQCQKHGAILVFDEVVTGMRVPGYFVSKRVKPDIVCFGKGVANGFSVAGIVMSKELGHETPYFVSSTYAGEAVSLCAHLETLKQHKNSNHTFEQLWDAGQDVQKHHNEMMRAANIQADLVGYGTRAFFKLRTPDAMPSLSLWLQQCLKSGLFVGRSMFMYYAHLGHVSLMKQMLFDAAESVKLGASLQGRPLKEPAGSSGATWSSGAARMAAAVSATSRRSSIPTGPCEGLQRVSVLSPSLSRRSATAFSAVVFPLPLIPSNTMRLAMLCSFTEHRAHAPSAINPRRGFLPDPPRARRPW
jgi:glutamate-1-semialdehyde aminotransferase